MLFVMVLGPRQPRNDIDAYLSPLIEDLTKLWGEGVAMFDGWVCETKRKQRKGFWVFSLSKNTTSIF